MQKVIPTEHPTFKRMKIIAALGGSSAKTPRGVLSWWRICGKAANKLFPKSDPMQRGAWEEAVKRRKEYPEAKRAAKDKKFRNSFLGKLRRRVKKLVGSDPLEVSNNIFKHRLELDKLRQQFELAKANKPVIQDTTSLIPIALHTTINATELFGFKLTKRGKNWTVQSSVRDSRLVHEEGRSQYISGRYKTVRRATNDNYIRCHGYVADDGTLRAVLHKTHITYPAPPGFYWGANDNGLFIAQTGIRNSDYHFFAHELMDLAELRMREEELLRSRQESAELDRRRKELTSLANTDLEEAGLEVHVCFSDSLASHNCRAGTQQFMRNNDLRSDHVQAAELLQLWKKVREINTPTADRIRQTVATAVVRHRREQETGYCSLTYHRRR